MVAPAANSSGFLSVHLSPWHKRATVTRSGVGGTCTSSPWHKWTPLRTFAYSLDSSKNRIVPQGHNWKPAKVEVVRTDRGQYGATWA